MTGAREKGGVSLKVWRPKEPVDSRALNQTNEAVEYLRRKSFGPRQVLSVGTAASGVAMFKIASVQGDYVLCNEFDGDVTGSEQIAVAKPYLLRASITSRNGITYTYTGNTNRQADNGASTEDQTVVPSFVTGDVIFASRTLRGTGVTFEEAPGVTSPVSWIDINADGRAWAKESA